MTKLTKPQMEMLVETERGGENGAHAVREYKPAQKLVELGFAKWRGPTSYLVLTDAGRAALSESSE